MTPLTATASQPVDGPLPEEWWTVVLDEPPVLGLSDPASLTLSGRLSLLADVQVERARLAALEADLLVAVAGSERSVRQVTLPDVAEGRDDSSASRATDLGGRRIELADEVVELVATALRRSPVTVRRQLAQARALRTHLPRTRGLLNAGLISPEHADVIARTADGLTSETAARLEAQVLPKAEHLSPGETAVVARRVRARIDTAGEEGRRRQARRHLDVRIWAEDDGLACLLARLPLADAARMHAALEERARLADVPCEASMGERRATALVDAVCLRDAATDGAASGNAAALAAVDVQVTVDLATLVGLRDDPAIVALGAAPAEPVTAAALRELLSDERTPVTIRRLVTDTVTGLPLDRGRRAYRVPAAARAFLAARDETCAFPHCTRAAERCDVDHVTPWAEGGTTDTDNLEPLCRRHHVLKTHAGWSVRERRPDGSTVWRGPDGQEYLSVPLRLPPAPPDPPNDPGPLRLCDHPPPLADPPF